MIPPRRPKLRPSGLRTAGMLLAIPSLLVISPLVGFFLGQFVDRRFESGPAWSIVGLALGFVAAGREIYLIIRRVQAEEEGDTRP